MLSSSQMKKSIPLYKVDVWWCVLYLIHMEYLYITVLYDRMWHSSMTGSWWQEYTWTPDIFRF